MSVPVVQEKGVTAITMETDRSSMLPPLSQILKTLCFNTRSSSLFRRSEGLKQSKTVSALGVIQLMVGLFHIGLGPGRTTLHPGDFAHLGVAYWLGGVIMLSGIVSLLANRFPFPLLVGSAVLMNIIGFIFTAVGVYRYSLDIEDITRIGFCQDFRDRRNEDNCEYVSDLFRRIVRGMDTTMMVLSVLTLFVCIYLAFLGIRALFFLRRREEATHDEIYHPEKEALPTGPDPVESCCFSRRTHRPMPYNTTAALGTAQIMVGVFNIGLGTGRTHLHPGDFHDWGVAYWLGGVFILAGVMSLCAEWFEGRCLVGFAVAVNIIGSILSIIGSELYVADILDYSNLGFCDENTAGYDDCRFMQYMLKRSMTGMDVSMIVLTVVQLFVCISVSALGIRDLLDLRRREEATHDEIYKPEKEALLTGPGA